MIVCIVPCRILVWACVFQLRIRQCRSSGDALACARMQDGVSSRLSSAKENKRAEPIEGQDVRIVNVPIDLGRILRYYR